MRNVGRIGDVVTRREFHELIGRPDELAARAEQYMFDGSGKMRLRGPPRPGLGGDPIDIAAHPRRADRQQRGPAIGLGPGGSPLAALCAGLLINARPIGYGLAVPEVLGTGWRGREPTGRRGALAGSALALLTTPLLPAGLPILLAAGAAARTIPRPQVR
ncbi:AzlC family ABC transporter permease [Nocardia zapadnayensis]|uniref:hypothetical protein n=1 Tax=Nocardia rhamnosiphila TaxID=426716 RepID=UPI002247850C|nr:hypothetical protein [Nocardia zapadnayensis]MCX0274495.1 AzlC family ABC transporter permease [Nocardia zapadnayensis]